MKLNELEIKIQIDSEAHFSQVYDKCAALFGAPASHVKQLDEYYDTADKQLKQQDLVIRIRSFGDKQTIALKSPRVDLPSGMNSRIELEFQAAESEEVQKQLHKQGLLPHEVSEKERWTFLYKECEIVLDRLPFIGSFVEIEGPSENEIHALVLLLNLSSYPVIRQNYGELMIQKFQLLGLPVSSICATFAKEQQFIYRTRP
jgi:adenylate cyclase, class 2